MPARSSSPALPRVAVIGAGIGGLSAAMTVLRSGAATCDVFEATDRPGGAICTVEQDGFRIELGPNTLLDRGGAISALIQELGLGHERIYPSTTSTKRYIVKNGALVALPTSPGALRKSSLFSARGKLRLLQEPLVPAKIDPELDESLYNLVSRRLGEEFADYALDPFLAGTYAGDPRQLSSRHALKRLKELEELSGSLMGGALASLRMARRARKQGAKKPPKSSMINFSRGAQTLTDAMSARLGDHLHLDAPISRLTRQPDGTWQLEGCEAARDKSFDGVIIALPAYVIATLDIFDQRDESPKSLAVFDEIYHPPITMMALGFERAAIAHPLDGFGELVPSREGISHLGALFASSVFTDRAPRDHALMMVFFGGARHPEAASWSEKEQVRVAREELGQLLGITAPPVLVTRRTWPRSIPQYEVGYGRILERVERIEADLPGVRFTGNWRDGIAVPDVVRHATHSAQTLLHTLASTR